MGFQRAKRVRGCRDRGSRQSSCLASRQQCMSVTSIAPRHATPTIQCYSHKEWTEHEFVVVAGRVGRRTLVQDARRIESVGEELSRFAASRYVGRRIGAPNVWLYRMTGLGRIRVSERLLRVRQACWRLPGKAVRAEANKTAKAH
jgi:hypothetical protein